MDGKNEERENHSAVPIIITNFLHRWCITMDENRKEKVARDWGLGIRMSLS